MKVRKNITLDNDILNVGLKNAKKKGLSFSTYVGYLILNAEEAKGSVRELPKAKVNDEAVDFALNDAIDNVLSLD